MPRRTRSLAIAAGTGGMLIAMQLAGAADASAATLPAVLSAIKQCESGGNYTAVNPSSGASGAYQFITSTWQSLSASAGYATAAAAPPAVQDAAALELYNADGTAPWSSSESCWGPLVASGTTSTSSTTTTTTTTTITTTPTSSSLAPASSTAATASPATRPAAPATGPAFGVGPRPTPGNPGTGRPCPAGRTGLRP